MYTLPHPVLAKSDESLLGLVMRNAQPYRFHQPMRLFKRLRPPSVTLWTFCQQAPDDPMGVAMAGLLYLDEEAFRRMTMWSGNEISLAVMGYPVWAELVRRSRRAGCSLCLQEGAYHRATWLLSAVPFCTKHSVRLRSHCHGCDNPVVWHGSDPCRCGNRKCRADLRTAPTEPVEPAYIASASALLDLFHGRRAAPLDMPVGEALRLSFLLGKFALGFRRKARAPGFIEKEAALMPRLLDTGWRALDDWPHGFNRFLQQMLEGTAANRVGSGLVGVFGKLSLLVWEIAREPWGKPFGAAFAAYAAAIPELRVSAKKLQGYAPGTDFEREYMSLSEAHQFLGISPVPMLAIVKRRNLYVLAPIGSGPSASLKTEDVRRLRTEMEDLILPAEARAILGIGMPVMDQLEDDGLVQRVPPAERVMESRPFRRSEVEALVAACVGDPPLIMAKDYRKHGVTPLSRAVVGHTAAAICRALANGQLQAAARTQGKRGLSQICIRMEDLHRALPVEQSTMSVVQAAAILKTKYAFLPGWIRCGLLEATTSERRNERGTRITAGALARFRRDYILGNEAAELAGQGGNMWFTRHLVFQGVQPVSGPKVDGCPVLLLRRADVTPEVIQAVQRTQAGSEVSPDELRKAALALGERVGEIVAARWGIALTREHSLYLDQAGGRALQVVVGRRPDMTGVFRFSIHQPSMARLMETGCKTWVALVPNQGGSFLLMPCRDVGWNVNPKGDAACSVKFDVQGCPLEFAEWAVEIGNDEGP